MTGISKFLLVLSKWLEKKSEKIRQKQKKKIFLKHIKERIDEIQMIESFKGEIYIVENGKYSTEVEKIEQIWKEKEKIVEKKTQNISEGQIVQENIMGISNTSNGLSPELSKTPAMHAIPKMQIPGSSFVIDEIVFTKAQQDIQTDQEVKVQEKVTERVSAMQDINTEEGDRNQDIIPQDDNVTAPANNAPSHPFFGFRGLR